MIKKERKKTYWKSLNTTDKQKKSSNVDWLFKETKARM